VIMGKTTGFIEYPRSLPILHSPKERIVHWNEFHGPLAEGELKKQGARCMNCGIPFCHTGVMSEGTTTGCPLHNLIPEWNDLVYREKWLEAYRFLSLTNNFPEFTGRVCPAPCESACVLGINDDPVMIKEIEVAIIDRAFDEGWIIPKPPHLRTGKKVAVIGSGPAGLACADELNKAGHSVTVFERDDRVGGLLMYGIPNMKLDKKIVERRVDLLIREGIHFRTNVTAGIDITAAELRRDFDATVFCGGTPKPRDLSIEGRGLKGIYFAMDFLTANTKRILDSNSEGYFINVKDKDVIVIGGGDTGTDCVGTAIRQGCKSLVQFEILPKPREKMIDHDSWLSKIRTFQVDYGQEEIAAVFGSDPREYCVLTKRFIGDESGNLAGVETIEAAWVGGTIREMPGTEKYWKADIVFLAMGFVGVQRSGLLNDLGVKITGRNTIAVDKNKQTCVEKIFAAGDCERGQSLVVWAIADGRKAAAGVKKVLR
jgi:glutamate synthase (NADPH/NADH) small chain